MNPSNNDYWVAVKTVKVAISMGVGSVRYGRLGGLRLLWSLEYEGWVQSRQKARNPEDTRFRYSRILAGRSL